MMMTPVTTHCPYCGEPFETVIEAGAGEVEYTEDCQVCCQPVVVRVRIGYDGEFISFEAYRENE